MGAQATTPQPATTRPERRSAESPPGRQVASLAFDRRVRTTGFVVVSGVLILVAFVCGWDTVAGLRWPFDSDHFRNIANAVTFKDGGVLSDAHYAGVLAWYSPLTSALLALGSLVTSVSVNRLGTQGGAVLNLVTPVALCWVTARWFGRRVAVLALVVYLFVLASDYPPWAVASYSPWLFVNVYAIGLFIIALAALPAAVNRGGTKDALLFGIAAGVVVLAHPAYAVLLAAVTTVQFLVVAWHASRAVLRRLLRSAGTSALVALAVSAPFWLPIMVRYRWHIENPKAGAWTWPELDSGNFLSFARSFLWRWPFSVIAVGLAVWVVRRRLRTSKDPVERTARTGLLSSQRPRSIQVTGLSILTIWTVTSFVGLLIEVYRDRAVVRLLPLPDAPSHHYLLALSVALCIWFGLSANAIVRAILARRDRRWGAAAVLAVVVLIAIPVVPTWRKRTDLDQGRTAAQITQAQFSGFAVVDWIRANTRREDRFLNVGPGLWNGMLLPGLADRKSVNINIPEYSNPFVDYGERQRAAEQMVGALRTCRIESFERLARRYGHVRYIITQPGSSVVSTCPSTIPLVYTDSGVSIQRIAVART
jgi:hypothetical protein